jgi:hypothetical protein
MMSDENKHGSINVPHYVIAEWTAARLSFMREARKIEVENLSLRDYEWAIELERLVMFERFKHAVKDYVVMDDYEMSYDHGGLIYYVISGDVTYKLIIDPTVALGKQ